MKFNTVYGDELWNYRTEMPKQKGKRAAPWYKPGRGTAMRTRSTTRPTRQPRAMPLESRERRAQSTRNDSVVGATTAGSSASETASRGNTTSASTTSGAANAGERVSPGRDILFPTAVPDPQYILPIRL